MLSKLEELLDTAYRWCGLGPLAGLSFSSGASLLGLIGVPLLGRLSWLGLAISGCSLSLIAARKAHARGQEILSMVTSVSMVLWTLLSVYVLLSLQIKLGLLLSATDKPLGFLGDTAGGILGKLWFLSWAIGALGTVLCLLVPRDLDALPRWAALSTLVAAGLSSLLGFAVILTGIGISLPHPGLKALFGLVLFDLLLGCIAGLGRLLARSETQDAEINARPPTPVWRPQKAVQVEEQRIAPPEEWASELPESVTPRAQEGPAPGWYPDPYRQSGERYWDGQQWTVECR